MEHIISGGYEQSHGKTTIAPEVLLTIVQLTTSNIPGVNGMSNVPGGVNRLFKRGYGDGVRLEIEDDNLVYVDLYLVLKRDFNIRDVSRKAQVDVSRAISEMVGIQVGLVMVRGQAVYSRVPYPAHAL